MARRARLPDRSGNLGRGLVRRVNGPAVLALSSNILAWVMMLAVWRGVG